jgi:hypothetical protein
MKRSFSTSLAVGVLAAFALQSSTAQELTNAQWNTLQEYCTKCHNLEDFSGGFAFDMLSKDDLHKDNALWEKIVRKLRGGMMPPPGQPRLPERELVRLVGGLEQQLDKVAATNPNPGAPVLHRMNRVEYANAIRDLLALPVQGEDLLPADDSAAGFDNIASVLSVSPALMQSYVTAAAKISRLALGDSTSSAGLTSFRPPVGISQSVHVDGLPIGTRGGMVIDYVFPLDADYEFTIQRTGTNNFALPLVGVKDPIEVAVDGERVAVLPADKPSRIKLPIKAGSHKVQVAFLHTTPEQEVDDMFAVHANSVSIAGIEMMGPLNPSGAGTTLSREKVFVCYPRESAEEPACARQIISSLATRAWRAPVTDAAVDDLVTFYKQGKDLRGFDTGVQYALARILVDPRFIYRFEREPEDLAPGTRYAIDDFELATRLSFFLWSSIPDDALLQLAEKGELGKPKVLEQQVERMLRDPRATALVENFAGQWLGLRVLDTINPTSTDYDGTLRESMKRETELLFTSILQEDRSITDLLDADYTFVDERLAKHYGIPNIQGSRFRRVVVTDDTRRGLLGHASILTLTSAPNRTSVVKRGQWILENFLGTPPPPPPPGVEVNLDNPPALGEVAQTLRQKMEKHRADPGCGACHGMIDPIGFALENFDAVGKWRDSTGGQPVDPTTKLWDGTPINGSASLRNALLARRDNFVEVAAEKLLTYGLGRAVDYYDMPTVRAIAHGAEKADFRLSALVKGVVNSPAFRQRIKQAPSDNTQVALED